jgi:hypothetical protein
MKLAGTRLFGALRSQRVARVVLVATAIVAVTPQVSMAARWLDSLPADDPDVVVRRGTSPALPPPQEASSLPMSIARGAGSVIGGTFYAATGVISAVADGISAIGTGTRQALWETAYMFGVNTTKMPRTEIADPVPVVKMSEEEGDAPVASAAPARAVTTAPVTPAAAAPIPAAPVITAAVETSPSAPIDPGLLGNFIFDRGARRPDGSFFVPKPLQRLFEVRTTRAVASEVPVTTRLAGRIIADPQAHGDVETSLLGRIEPPPTGLPVLGDSVRKGQILGYVIPAVGVVDRTQVRREVARLTTDIRVETENLEILKQFSFVPFRDGKIYQSEQRLAGLRRERDALLPMLQTQEALRAPTDGVISTSTAIAGRIVHPGEKVYEIVNPKMLWIEAYAPDPTIAASAQRVATASATTPEGQALALTFVGSGLALQQQSTPILFRIDNPPADLRVGRPVSVAVQSETRSARGLPMTRDALTIGSDGIQEVWEQSEPEVFLPHAVKTADLDGRSVLIVDGLKEGARVVVNGVRLLAQLQ